MEKIAPPQRLITPQSELAKRKPTIKPKPLTQGQISEIGVDILKDASKDARRARHQRRITKKLAKTRLD